MKIPRYLQLTGATGQIRTAMFQNREHVVVPVVALMEAVVWPVNAKQAEFVPAEELAYGPQGWNGRPVVPIHPVDGNGMQILANNPRVLEQHQFGMIFNAEVRDKKLLLEAWLDSSRADLVGAEAKSVIERAKEGKSIEVSVGALIDLEMRSGDYNGQHYDAVWHKIVPDHLAMLPEGKKGACSNDMGCGAPRAAEASPMSEVVAPDKEKKPTLTERIASLMKWRSNTSEADMSDADLRQALNRAINAVEPGYLGIDKVFPGQHEVVYAVAPEDKVVLYRRSYKVAKDSSVTLSEKKEEVQPVTTYEPVTASAAPCSCHDGGGQMKTKAERIQALIAGGKFKDADKTWLEQIPEDRLEALEQPAANQPAANQPAVNQPAANQPAANQPPANQPAANQPPANQPAGTQETGTQQVAAQAQPAKPVSMEEYLKTAPPELKEVLQENLRVAAERKTAAITALKTCGRCDYTEDELKAMSIKDLERLVKLTGATSTSNVDFSGRGLPVTASNNDDANTVPPPPDLYGEIRAAAKK
jgi:Uncharacterized protein conserved in bacteria (DUF2213)